MDARIGRYEDGRRVLPALTLDGRPVRQPVVSTMGLDDAGKYFVVLDAHKVKDFKEKVAALQEEVAALNLPPEAAPEEAIPSMDALAVDALPVQPVKRGRRDADAAESE